MSEALYQDEAVFLAHSVALEQEATERLYELADTLEIHNNRSLSSLLRELAAYSEQHARQVAGLCQGHSLPGLRAWEYAWPQDESPEVFHYSQVHYLLQAEQALQVALEVEQNAAAFYRDVAARTHNPQIQRWALLFAGEEEEHVRKLQARLLQVNAGQSPRDHTDFDPPQIPE